MLSQSLTLHCVTKYTFDLHRLLQIAVDHLQTAFKNSALQNSPALLAHIRTPFRNYWAERGCLQRISRQICHQQKKAQKSTQNLTLKDAFQFNTRYKVVCSPLVSERNRHCCDLRPHHTPLEAEQQFSNIKTPSLASRKPMDLPEMYYLNRQPLTSWFPSLHTEFRNRIPAQRDFVNRTDQGARTHYILPYPT